MELKGHLLYYPEGKHDINLNNYVQLEQLRETSDAINNSVTEALKSKIDSITKTTYADLKNLRDNSQLVPGSLYRITDYQCTTTQENTRSAGHQFDIVLLALSENKLAEESWAMMNESNIYDVTFADGVTKRCYITSISDENVDIVDIETLLGVHDANIVDEIHIDEGTKTASMTEAGYSSLDLNTPNLTYNYFQNSNLSAWKVWYSLDNDTDRFAWADAGSDYIEISVSGENKGKFYRSSSDDTTLTAGGGTYNLYAWKNPDLNSDNIYYTWQTDSPIEDTVLRNAQGAQYSQDFTRIVKCAYKGRGVIYRLIDEWNNDVPYDFKNIMCTLTLDDYGQYDEEGNITYVYTFDVFDIDSNSHKDMSVTMDADTNKVLVQNVQWKQDMSNENEAFVPLLSLNIFYKWNFGGFYNLDLNTSYNNIFLAPVTNVTAGQLYNCVFLEMASCTFGHECNALTLTGGYDLNYGNRGVELATKDDLN